MSAPKAKSVLDSAKGVTIKDAKTKTTGAKVKPASKKGPSK